MRAFFIPVLIVATMALGPLVPARADDVVIQRGDGPVSITIRNAKPKAASAPLKGEREATLAAIREVLADYASKNHYSEFAEVKCKQMSEAVWYRLRTRGVRVRLAGGNVETQVTGAGFETYTNQANHAWVMAYVPDQGWLALECTNGSIVQQKDNPLYYTSAIFFETPEQVYRFDGLRRQAADGYQKLKKLTDEWNAQYAGQSFKPGSNLGKEIEAKQAAVLAAKKEYEDLLVTLQGIYERSLVLQ